MKKRVLIVDDSTTNLYMLETILKGYGFEVISAENGKEALEKAHLNPPDLIVTDILMPVMDGYALCRRWRSDDTLKHIPLVFYTATYTGSKNENFALGLGADRFILKPQEPDILMNILKEVLEESYVAKQVAAKPLEEEMEVFRQYNEILFKKLEKKMLDLEIANQELMILEERYRLSFENVSDVIYTMDKDLRIISISPSLEKILGYKPQDFIGRSASDFENILTPESFEQAVADISSILEGETIVATIYQFIAKDGTIKHGEVSGSPVMRDGKIIGIISVARDITDRKLAEEALRESEEKYRSILESMDDAYYELDLHGNLVFFNEALISKTGYSREELMGMNYRQYISPETYKPVSRVFSEIYRTGQAVKLFDYEVIMKSGQKRDYESWADLLFDKNGRPVGFKGMARDITTRKRAETALRKSESNYRLLAENVNDVIFVLDMNMNYTYVSPSVKFLRGYEPAEVLKQTPFEILTPSSQDLAVRTLSEVIALEKSGHREIQEYRSLELEMWRKDGTTVWTEVNFSFIRDENQRPVGILGVTRDITERKRTEEELQRVLERLRKAIGATIQVMVSAVEVRDPYTAGHQMRSANLARCIATEMGLPQEKIEGIRMAGSIHDIGKLSVPAEILSKPTKLTNIEFSLIKVHPQKGYEMLKDVESPWPLAEIVYQHHERMDGSGYPRNLKGGEILMEARILAVSDVVESMSSHRPYRPSLGLDIALEEIKKNRGILYDNAVADACLRLFYEKGYQLS